MQKVSLCIDYLQSRLKPAGEGAPIHWLEFLVSGGYHQPLMISSSRWKAKDPWLHQEENFFILFCFGLLFFSENLQCNSIPKLPDDYRKFKIDAICFLGVLHNISFGFQSVEC